MLATHQIFRATLYFGYARLDYYQLTQGQFLEAGPDRPGQAGWAFDIYEASVVDDAWQVVRSTVNSPIENVHEAAIGVDRHQQRMAFVRFDGAGDIYIADRQGSSWGAASKAPEPLNSPCVEDNPHLSPDGNRIYFDSNRADPTGTSCGEESERSIYVSELVGGSWSTPKALDGAMNDIPGSWQMFVTDDENTAYWSGADTDCEAISCIYRAYRQPDGSFALRELVASATPVPFLTTTRFFVR